MKRILWSVFFGITILTGIAWAQQQSSTPTSTSQQSTPVVSQGTTQNGSDTEAPSSQAVTPSSQSASSASTPSDPSSEKSADASSGSQGTQSMPKTASPTPLVGLVGLVLLAGAIGLSARPREN